MMENGQNVKSLELIVHSMSSDDIMNRRLKNRERQRRYRLRKKMEADSKKEFVPIQPTRPQEVVELSGNRYNVPSRVLCKRNWKKDARSAYASKKSQESPVIATISASALKTVETPLERQNNQVDAAFSCTETKAKLATRDWKAEARRKKN